MKKKLIIIVPILIAIVAFVFVYRYYNKEDKTTTLTVAEKKWAEENKEQAFDFEVVNDYPLYGTNGEGVLFDFINDFEDKIRKVINNELPDLTQEGYKVAQEHDIKKVGKELIDIYKEVLEENR